MSKQVKEMVISALEQRFGDTRDFLVVDTSKMDAVTTNQWRLALKKQEISAISVKNALARRALSQIGIDGMEEVLAGPSTLVWGGEDIVSLSKEIAKWAKEIKKLEIKGGTTEGKALNSSEVEVLSKSPGRLELIGEVVMLALSPGASLAGALLGPGGKVAGCVKAIADKEE